MLVAGDVFHGPSTPAERNAAIQVFAAWAERMPVVVVYGNHDIAGDLDFLAKLRTRELIQVSSIPERVSVLDGPVEILRIGCLPWPRKAFLAGVIDSSTDLNAAAADAMRNILQGFSMKWGADTPRVLLAHAEIGIAVIDNGQPLVGKCDIHIAKCIFCQFCSF